MLAAARILGSGGFYPTDHRETSSLLVLADDSDEALVVDAGTGIRRLMTDRSLLADRARLHVLLTHFHPDHICGLPYLEDAGMPIVVHGPGAALHDDTTTGELLDRHYVWPVWAGNRYETYDYAIGDGEIAGIAVTTRVQEHHPGRSVGLRFGDALVWCTDTARDAGIAQFARGARVRAHDSWTPAHANHTLPAEAAQLAVDGGVPTLVLIHVPPHADDQAMLAAAAAVHPNVVLASDELDLLAV